MSEDILDDPPRKPKLDLKKVVLAIGTPAKSLGPPEYIKSLFDFLPSALKFLGGITWFGSPARTCAEARTHIAHEFVNAIVPTHLMWIDADTEFKPQTILEMLMLDKPIVVGAYPNHGGSQGCYRYNVELLPSEHAQEPVDGCLKIGAAGLGFCLMQRAAVEEMTAKYRETLSYSETAPDGSLQYRVGLFHEPLVAAVEYGREGGRAWMGEDFQVFYRWRGLGPGHDVHWYLNAPLVHHIKQPMALNAADKLDEIMTEVRSTAHVLAPTRLWHQEILGWADDILPWIRLRVPTLPEDARIVECGSFKGRSGGFWGTELARWGKSRACVWLIDPGVEWPNDSNDSNQPEMQEASRDELLKNLAALKPEFGTVKVESIAETSLEAVKHFEDGSLDVVFLDDDHTYRNLSKEIVAWLPKVKSGGGILAGHDFSDAFPGVVKAVAEAFSKDPTLKVEDSVWLVVKP